MTFAERTSHAAAAYAAERARARKYPPAGVRGASGIKRDRIERKASADYAKAMRSIGVRTY